MTDAPDAPHGGGEGAGHGLKGAMGRKLGPLPMGVWILAVGGGLVLTYYMRRATPTDAGTDTSSDTAAPDTGGTGQGSWPYGFPNGVGQTGSTGTGDSTGTDSTLPTTNEQWQRRAVQILVGRGYEPTAVDRAIAAYLGGESLTTTQRAIINEAIILIGPPPVSPPSPTTPDKPPPTTTPPTPPKPTHPPTPPWHFPKPPAPGKPKPQPTSDHITLRITKRGQTLSDLTAAYNSRYHKHITWQEAWDFNLKYRDAATVATLKKRGPNKTYVGSSFWFPKP
ncbi:hypothetical protein ACIQVT_34550 [Streptomyces sp. NPDC100445]|uniref:hypothetical protein n=1 Tax=Streptomyces sp. NPDC100445 TaxID=3366102 RepID=UPI00382E2A4C